MAEPAGELLTSLQAASRAGVTPSGLRTLAGRALQQGTDLRAPASLWPDKRTPMYDAGKLAEYLAGRPGRGRRGADGGG